MATSLLLINEFRTLFKIDESVHGVHSPEIGPDGKAVVDDKGKTKGKSWLAKEPVTESVWSGHLQGTGKPIGGCMLYDGEHTMFSVIDVDTYDNPTLITSIVNKVYNHGLPIVPFRSKSGGLHLYTFYESPVTGAEAIQRAQILRRLLKLPSITEVFPKQKRIEDAPNGTDIKRYGGWINLPYYDISKTVRYAIDSKHRAMPVEIAIEHIKGTRVNKSILDEFLSSLPFFDGPPCLQTIWMDRDTSQRNKYLFAVGVYAKSKYGDLFEQHVIDANAQLTKPIEISEVANTVLASLKRKDYSYTCNDDPLKSVCQREVCKLRTFGIGGENISDLTYEQLTQMGKDHPYYRWQVNKVNLVFQNESEIINQQRFRELAMRELHVLPNRLAEPRWVAIVNNALKNMDHGKDDEIDDVMMAGGVLTPYIGEFLTQGALAPSLEHVMFGKVFKDPKREMYIFKGRSLVEYIIEQKRYRSVTEAEIQEKLHSLGGITKRIYINSNNKACRVWQIPWTALEGKIDDMSGITAISYMEDSPKEEGQSEF